MTPARLAAALPPRAASALALAREHDSSCDVAAAWLATATHQTSSPAQLAGYLRAQARRDRRAGGAHGPAAFLSTDDPRDPRDFQDDYSDPFAVVSAFQAVAQRPGLSAALAEREDATDTLALAQREGITRRRAQQLLAARKRAEDAGQQGLFAGSDQ